MNDFTTMLKILLEKFMNEEHAGSKPFWAVWVLALLALLLYGGAAMIAAISQLLAVLQ